MRPISPRVKRQIDRDGFFKRCCITGSPNVSMEHCWVYGGRQIDEIWAIVPLRRDLNTSHPPREIKEKCRLVSLMRASDEDFKKYPRKNWKKEFKILKNKYKNFYEKMVRQSDRWSLVYKRSARI